MAVTDREAIPDAARSFLRAALVVLRREHVVPPSTFHPYLEVGRDYYGPDLNGLQEYIDLETALTEAFPERFGENAEPRDFFQSSYIFRYLEAFIAECAIADSPFDPNSSIAAHLIDALGARLSATEHEVVCCRVVSHLTTADDLPIELQGLTVLPETPGGPDIERHILDTVPGAPTAYNRERPSVWNPPHALIVARDRGRDPVQLARELSSRIEGFMLNMRLLHASTAQSLYESRSETSLIRRLKPELLLFDVGPLVAAMATTVRRTTRLLSDDEPAFSGLSQLIDEVNQAPENVSTPFDIAVDKLVRSFGGGASPTKIVDLATALEAMLSGRGSDDVTLRLKTRAAALLVGDEDPAASIFDDVNILYSLRSKLVHGGRLTAKELQKRMHALSTVPDGTMAGVVLSYAIDRFRDVVRRAALARLCLASGDNPKWPMSKDQDPPVDSILSDEPSRQEWRDAWHSKLDAIGAAFAIQRARPVADPLTLDDG